jgi:hypothetical protein
VGLPIGRAKTCGLLHVDGEGHAAYGIVVQRELDEVVRSRSRDDLEALADAVREAARPSAGGPNAAPDPGTGRRGHLRALPTPG